MTTYSYAVQTKQLIEGCANYRQWRTVARYATLAQAQSHERFIVEHSHSLDTQIVTSTRPVGIAP